MFNDKFAVHRKLLNFSPYFMGVSGTSIQVVCVVVASTPFEIARSAVTFILVFVVYFRQIIRIRDECYGNKTVNWMRSYSTLFR